MVAGFASGFAFSLVSGVAPQSGPSLQAAFSSGVVFAAFQGGIYAVRLHSRQPAEQRQQGSLPSIPQHLALGFSRPLQSRPAGGSSTSLKPQHLPEPQLWHS